MGDGLRRRCIAVAFAAVLVLVACGGSNSNPPAAPAANNGNNGAANNPSQDQTVTPNIKISVTRYESCHDPSQKKSSGNSDGLWDMTFGGAPDKTKVTVKFKSSIGDKEVTGNGVTDDTGQVTIRVPLQSFGEVLEVVSAHLDYPDGTTDDLSGADVADIQKETVESSSQCGLEDDATADASPN